MIEPRRVDPVLWLALALAAGPALALSPWASSLTAALVAWRLRGRLSLQLRLLALVLLGLSAARVHAELQEAGRLQEAASAALAPPRRCELEAVVVRSPVLKRSGRDKEGALGMARIDVTVLAGDCEGKGDRGDLAVGTMARLYAAPEDLLRGDRLWLVADVGVVRAFNNPGLADPRVRIALTGIAVTGVVVDLERLRSQSSLASHIDRARGAVRARIEASFPQPVAPFARALVLGETDLQDDDQQAFRRSGLAHLLAVSGTHLIIAVLALAALLHALLVRVRTLACRFDVGRLVAAITVPLCWLYADFAGGGGSAYRAAAMLSLAMVARAAGRRPSVVRCFALSLAGGALIEPLAICDLSFALSVAATSGLLLVQRPLAERVARQPRPLRPLLAAIGATAAAVTGCAPVLLSLGPQLPLVGIAANVIAAPIGELAALPLCLAHAVLGWAPLAERGAAIVASGALELVRAVAHAASASPYATLELPPPTSWQLAAVVCGAFSSWLATRRRCLPLLIALAVCGGLELATIRQAQPSAVLRVTVLDVGQGDALLLDLPDGRLMVIDAGGLVGSPIDVAERVLLPVLRSRRRREIDVMVLTHPHPDHYGGLQTLLSRLPARELWISGVELEGEPGGALATTLRAARRSGTRLVTAAELCPGERLFGAARVEVLAPCPRFHRGRRANDNSLVLRITLGRRAALLVGDAESVQEQELVRNAATLRADFLKVGHHGSRTSSSPAFLDAVSPSLAVVSCGARNRFGHPHDVTPSRLEQRGSIVLRTDRGGAVVWQTDGEHVSWWRPGGPRSIPN